MLVLGGAFGTFTALLCSLLVVDCFKVTVDALVKNKASLSAVDRKQRTPLHYLVIHSRLGGALQFTLSFNIVMNVTNYACIFKLTNYACIFKLLVRHEHFGIGYFTMFLQCFDAVGWVAGRASDLYKKLGAGIVICLG